MARISLAKDRIQSVLDKQVVAHQKTLEQKISDQGPRDQQVDPHLVGHAVRDLLELNRLKIPSVRSWYANVGTAGDLAKARLAELLPIHDATSGSGFGNLVGDALEVVIFKCLEQLRRQNAGVSFLGQFDLTRPKVKDRFFKTQPPKFLSGLSTKKEADYILSGIGPLSVLIECKNLREWVYPRENFIRELIGKSLDLDCIPLLVARRIHYTTRVHFFQKVGIIYHESLFQYYPSDQIELALKASHKNLLGFSDIRPTEEPHRKTLNFFLKGLAPALASAAPLWLANKEILRDYADGELSLEELYSLIGDDTPPF